MMSVQSGSFESFSTTLSSYSKFRMALKSREVQRQYPNLLEKFLDFCRFEGLDIEQKSLEFFRFAKDKSQDEVEDIIIRFVSFQKERIDRQEITAGTLRNYVKAIKLFCRMNRINISWDIIVRYLPKVKQYANDRIPTVDEMKKLIQYPDRRIKLIILLSGSTGIRVGA
jgi:integrase